MRPGNLVEVVKSPESHVSHDIPSDDGVLFGIMVASGLLLLIRVSIMLIWLCRHSSGEVSQADEKNRNISKGMVFFIVALATVLMKIASVTAHGLVAINWLLAGAEPGVPLVACFVLVAINTYLLTSVAIVVHLRALLASVAICKQSNIKFQGITNLWGAPAGAACLLMNWIATAILLAYLHHRSGKITTWLVTAMSFLLWANTNFKSVGLMDSETWKDLQLGSVSKPPIPAAEFMRSIGMIPGSQQGETDETGANPTHVSKLLQMVFLKFNKDDELLLHHRQRLLRCALPESPRLRFVHGGMILFLGLLSSAVPSILVGYCLSRTPLLSDVEVVGGNLAPSFSSSRFDYYIQVQHAGSSGIKMTFLMDLGEASAYTFCCQAADCSKVEAHDSSSQLRLQSIIVPKQFGTCQLELRGLRRSSYTFTVLALRNLVPSLSIAADESFAPYDPKRYVYHMDIIKPDMDSLMLATKFDMDQTRMRVAISAKSCAANSNCSTLRTANSPGSVDVNVNISAMTGPLNVTLVIALRPAQDIDMSTGNASAYTVSLMIFTIKDRLKHLLWQISELKAHIATGQEVDSPGVAENVKKLAEAVRSRDELLRRAQRARDCQITGSHERFTFLAVGVTGTGKSELCRWMTGNETACPSSDSLGSHTEEVQQVPAHAFADACQPLIEWIDTPGRGDTRGKDHDAKLWNNTMAQLKHANTKATRIHRIVWVINAAWKRATDVRELMLKELRMPFGVDLYKNLAIVLNFLPRTTNKTAYREIKQRHKERFVEWIMQREDVMFQWPPDLRKGVEDEVNDIAIYGININPKYLQEKPSDVPISTPYLNLFYPFSDAGVDDLTALLTSTVNQTRGGRSLLLDNPHPRVGPGQAKNISLALTCRPWRLKQDNAKELEPGGALITFEAHGKYFSGGDKALLLPASASCGDRSAERWPDRWWTKVLSTKPHLPGNLSTTFQSELQSASPQVCFCEASGCNESWRFGQKLPFQLPEDDCKPIKVYSVDAKNPNQVANPWNLVSVGKRVFGVPKDPGLPIFEYRVLEGRMTDYKDYTFEEEHQKHWFQTVVSNNTLYLLAKEGKFFLPVDIDQHEPMPGKLVDTHTGLTSDGWHFFGMAIVGSLVYLIPGTESSVRILDMVTGTFRSSLPIEGLQNDKRSRNKFGFPRVSQNNIFAPPWEVEAFFVMNVLDESVQIKQIAFDPWEPMKIYAWSEFVEFGGFLYASPYNEKTVLRVNTGDLTWSKMQIEWPRWRGPRWSGSAVLGRRIFFASTDSLETVPVLDTDTQEVKYIVAESLDLEKKAHGVDWFSGGQRSVVAVDNTLQFSPGLSGNAIVVVNVSAGFED